MKKAIFSMAVMIAFGATGLSAQSMNVGANVASTAVFTGAVQALEFGTMTPGTETADREVSLLTTTQNAETGNAGWIDVRLNKNGTSVGFTLPGSLDGSGDNTLSVNAWECGLEKGSNASTPPSTPATTGDFDAYSASCGDETALEVTGMTGAKLVRIYLGGTILGSEIDSALAGDYTGEITITTTVP